ncbi:MAG: PilT/PilU family type 4a pilus ATPase [Lentisphaeria bacterium]|nr:PilT/PilU family type 4a pilus ATPase [Lentisphaeria bacterium]
MLFNLLKMLNDQDITDIFFTVGKIPYARINGAIAECNNVGTISQEDFEKFRNSYLTAEMQKVYQQKSSFDVGFEFDGRRFRANFYETLSGSAAVIRPLKDGNSLSFENLNLPPQIKKLAQSEHGIILLCGTTGSGKSSTLGAMINYINQNYNRHILTLEDPIEFVYKDNLSIISQREIIDEQTTFSEAMRAAMRENPDCIVIGEMRDTETMQAAINAALTGHLVISTVHTSNTIQAVERIVNLFPADKRDQIAQDLGMAISGIVAQKLIPSLNSKRMQIACEILLGTPLVKKLIANQKYADLDFAIKEGWHLGMVNFSRSIFNLYKDNKISLERALASATNPEELNLLLKGMESGVDAFRSSYSAHTEDGSDSIDMARLLRNAIRYKSSDLILSAGARPSVRLHGAIRSMELPILTGEDTQKLLFGIINQHQRVILEEKRELDFALAVQLKVSDKEEVYRFRINAFYQRGHIGIVARVIESHIPEPETLKLPHVLLSLIEKKQGLILVTGPTGSGKTTTLASLINVINERREAHIITIEDPIEFVHENINSIVEQRELNTDTLTFVQALKYALRQDPDVIMVGEMRDTETIASALTAAETGHLVFATIHTNSAPQTIDRIVDSFPSDQQNQIRLQLAAVLLGVVSQRLIPKKDGSGRVAAFEVMVGTSAVQALVREGKTHQLQSAMETGYKDGMQTLDKALEELYSAGLIDYKETELFKLSSTSVDFVEQ